MDAAKSLNVKKLFVKAYPVLSLVKSDSNKMKLLLRLQILQTLKMM